jgi:hypothetical protein
MIKNFKMAMVKFNIKNKYRKYRKFSKKFNLNLDLFLKMNSNYYKKFHYLLLIKIRYGELVLNIILKKLVRTIFCMMKMLFRLLRK